MLNCLKFSLFITAAFVLGFCATAQSCNELEQEAAEKRIEGISPFAVLSEKSSLSRGCRYFAFYRLFDRSEKPIKRYYLFRQVSRHGFGREAKITKFSSSSTECSAVKAATHELSKIKVPQQVMPALEQLNGPKTIGLDGVTYTVTFRSAGLSRDREDFGASVSFSSWHDLNPSISKWWSSHPQSLEECRKS